MSHQIWIVDFGSQYTQLITRRSREIGFRTEIKTLEEVQALFQAGKKPNAIILSGGPQSVFEDQTDYSFIFKHYDLPILGICYGMQMLGKYFGGNVEKGIIGEYGHAEIENVISGFPWPNNFKVWMSHSDHVNIIPKDFEIAMKSHNGIVAGLKHKSLPIMGLQFHPEVEHSEHGRKMLQYFFQDIAHISPDWNDNEMLEECLREVKAIGDVPILCAFSGGVDSLVAATLTAQVYSKNLYCFFVDQGLLRPQDLKHIQVLKRETKLNIEIIDAKDYFVKNLQGVSDPETKRKIIGKSFIEIFEEKVKTFERDHGIKFQYLLQGTLYPDVIESISPHKKGGKSVTIKSHHNVGGLPERMNLKLLEPLRFLFKDEVRTLGMKLGLKKDWIFRHPFPGPGIGVRILGEVFPDSIRKVQESDQILFEELKEQHLYDSTWQAFTVLIPAKTVGVKGDGRVYEEVIALRLVNSSDGMTATPTELPWSFLHKVSSRITNEVKGVTRVVYDITGKPPGTIEWE